MIDFGYKKEVFGLIISSVAPLSLIELVGK